MVMGRPKKYNNCLDLDGEAELYFESCEYEDDGEYIERKEPIPYTITGLAMALDLDRVSILNYSKDTDFFSTIKRHKLRVENDYEISLRKNGRAGEIFGLKNFGWKDKQEIDMNAKHSMQNKTDDEIDNKIKEKISKLNAGDK